MPKEETRGGEEKVCVPYTALQTRGSCYLQLPHSAH